MRKHFYLVTDARDESRVGGVEATDIRYTTAEKNVETVLHKRNHVTGDSWDEKIVSLGYYDFDDEADYEENAFDVIKQKLGEVDESHLEKAGLEPQEVVA